MSVTNVLNSKTMAIYFEDGKKIDGTPNIVSQRFSSVSGQASDAAIYNMAVVIGAVKISAPVEIKKLEDYSLNQE
ncbi:MAG: DUF1659 domain-containing protein [Clostridium sp.]|uniref:DUF1659 domain-containing protein n=1 Tax=Bacillota TaxID=1239 RepID=UPI002FC73E9F